MRNVTLHFMLLPVFFALHSAAVGTWYVDDSVSSSGDGKSWGTAFKTIQQAIDSAGDAGDTVTVAEGIYLENVNFNGKNIVRGVVTGQSLTVMLDRHFPMNEEPKAPCGRP